MEKHELSKIDFEIIENALNSLLQSRPDPLAADKTPIYAISFVMLSLAGWRLNKRRRSRAAITDRPT